MESVGVFNPSIYLHVGDAYDTDVMGAMASGWYSVLITNNSVPTVIPNRSPTLVVSTLEELYNVFKQVLAFSVCWDV